MADVRLTVKAASVRFPRHTQAREFSSIRGDIYTDGPGGDRFGVTLLWNVVPATWRALSAQITEAATPGNFLILDLFDATSYRRTGRGDFAVAANAEAGATEVEVGNSFDATGDFLLSVGSIFSINNELKQVVNGDVVGSADFSRRQLRLKFQPALRSPVRRGFAIEADSPEVRLQMVGRPPAIGTDGRAYGKPDVPWRGVYRAEFVEVDPVRAVVSYDPETGQVVDPEEPDDPNAPPVADAGPALRVVKHGSRVTLDGSASRDSDGQVLSYAWDQVGSGATVALTTPNEVTTAFTAPGADTTLTFRLSVTDDDGEVGTDFVEVQVRADGTETDPPHAPTVLAISPAQTSAKMSCTPATTGGPADLFEVRVVRTSTGGMSGWRPMPKNSNGVPFKDFKGLQPDNEYTAECRAVNNNGMAQITRVFRTLAIPAADPNPAPPSSLLVTAGTSTASLRWTAPTGTPAATGYRVQIGEEVTETILLSIGPKMRTVIRWRDAVSITPTRYAVRGLVYGKTYAWRVWSLNGDLYDAGGAVRGPSFTPRSDAVPIGPVTNLLGTQRKATAFRLSWAAPATGVVVRGYHYNIREIGIRGLPGGRTVPGWKATTRATRIEVTGLKPSTTYRCFVTPLGATSASNGPYTSIDVTTIAATSGPSTPPPNPSSGTLAAEAGDALKWQRGLGQRSDWFVTASGSASGGTGGYDYAWSIVGSATNLVLTNLGGGRASLRLLAARRNVTLRLTVTDSAGATATDVVSITS